jgi:predicted lactoylglutathione lyase
MSRKIFVNLPVKDLKKSMEFFRGLGFSFNPQFTDETAACMVISEDIYAMLVTHPKFEGFAPNPICDATRNTEVLVCLSCDGRSEVNTIADKAVAGGGKNAGEPMDYGFMYGRSVQDLDGHVWEFMWMDPSAIQQDAQ